MAELDPELMNEIRRLVRHVNRLRTAVEAPAYTAVTIGEVDRTKGTAEIILPTPEDDVEVEAMPGVPFLQSYAPQEGETALMTLNGDTPLLVGSASDEFSPLHVGRLEAYAGPELQANGHFNDGIDGWDPGEGAQFYLFDNEADGVLGWTILAGGATGALAWADGSNNLSFAQNKGAMLAVVGTVPTDVLTLVSPLVAVTAGTNAKASAYVKYDNNEGPVQCTLRWYNSGGTLIGTSSGRDTTVSVSKWDSIQVEGVAPVGTTHARIGVVFNDVATGTIARVDTSFITLPANATIAHEQSPVALADDFSRLDDALDVGAPVPWSLESGNWTTYNTLARLDTRTSGANAAVVEAGSNDYTVIATLRGPFTVGQGIVWRWQNSSNYWRATIYGVSSNNLVFIVSRIVGGVKTDQTFFNVPIAIGTTELRVGVISHPEWQSFHTGADFTRRWIAKSDVLNAYSEVGLCAIGSGAVTYFSNFGVTQVSLYQLDGSPTMRITSLDAGMASARTPSGSDSPGFPVRPGEWYITQFAVKPNAANQGRIISFASVYYDTDGAFVGIQFAPPVTPTTEWVTCRQGVPVPGGAAYMRLYAGFIANGAGERVYVDNLTVRRASTLVQPIWMSAPEGQARFEMVPSNQLRMLMWPTDDPTDEPGSLMAESATLTIQPPKNETLGKTSTLVLPADKLDFRQFGTPGWNAWLPEVTGFSLGDGSAVGRWMKIGTIVHYSFIVTFGSTSSFGGTLRITAPFARLSGAGATLPTGAVNFQASGGVPLVGTVTMLNPVSSGDQFMNFASSAGLATVNSSTPFAWDDGDRVFGSITYEAFDSGVTPL